MAVKWQGRKPWIFLSVAFTPEQQAGFLTGETQLAYKRDFRHKWSQLRWMSADHRAFYRAGYIFWRSELKKVTVKQNPA